MKKNFLGLGVSLGLITALLPVFTHAAGRTRTNTPPTNLTVTNAASGPVYVNLILGQPPADPPPKCSNLGQQIKSIADPRLKFKSSTGNTVAFKPQTANVTTKGYYRMAAGETITYVPQTFKCADGTCSPALTFNFFFTPSVYNGDPNNGCGASTTFPNATNLAEGSINFGINGSVGSGCANADATDISIVNGVNASLALSLSGSGWPFRTAENGALGTNANRQGVYGWAATNCVNSAGYPNPSATCAAPVDAPRAVNGQCKTPKGVSYPPIVAPNGTQYCSELSDAPNGQPQGLCVSQRPGNVTGGTVAIKFSGFIPQKKK
ncbi:MAG TPA: hypothetical protein VF911_13580 [Thermoanaerobaculia bacterium]|jgi:hypothetical protein